ncbi:ABC transporter permease [Phytohabitans sp. ZYX-F-186]|uniref:ABC transporter permease n=1 Tax=Phytohabitans maris TaxID=3071409 RepID=A0ABU0ZPA2_9ACTN|nr:ABC transporter permease [Phytohabitans sp. ZYX-F-186]MDQ7908060.1 ABC transporter permease [Phytohabitans sp. ZYX-F-186]
MAVVAGRVAEMAALVLVISLVSFGLLCLTRGDAATSVVREQGGPVTQERIAAERHRLGLDLPPHERYVDMLGRAVTGDLGVSVRTGRPVAGEVVERIGPTLRLALAGSLVAVLLGLAIGLVENAATGRVLPAVSRGLSLLLVSVPAFALAFALVDQFSVRLGWFPTQGMAGGLRALVLPALVLGLPAGAALGRVLSTRLREVMAEPYLVMARAQGFSRGACLLRTALPNAAVTSLVVAGNILAALGTGTLVVEEVFGWPGLGSYLISALRYRDWQPLQASVLLLSVVVIVSRGASLALAALVDPRARSTA